MDRGAITGSVQLADGTPMAAVTVQAQQADVHAETDASGTFTFADLPIGAYTLRAQVPGYATAVLEGVGVVGGATTQVAITLQAAADAPATIEGVVQSAAGRLIAGAVVTVEGQSATATTSASGAFTLAPVQAGLVYLHVQAPAGYLDGGNRIAHEVPAGGAIQGIEITLSGRPSDAATYRGESACLPCHIDTGAAQHLSGHHRFLTPGTGRMVLTEMWPAVGETLDTGVDAVDPIHGADYVRVYLCQNTAGAYAMKFGGAADCLISDTTLIPVSATIGGEGDGGVDNRPNFGVYKQRWLAAIADVPYAANHWTVTHADAQNDYLILPVYVVQAGNEDPELGAVSPKFDPIYPDKWVKQARTIGRLCSGCHATGTKLTFEGPENLLTSFTYADLNITCERCHGPGSEHATNGDRDNIITPKNLTALAAQQACGQCHAAHSGSSGNPAGAMKHPFDVSHLEDLGSGFFVPGLYDLSNFIKGYDSSKLDGGGVETWPDRTHTFGHSQQLPSLLRSKHANNSTQRLACFDCHEAHSTYYGPERFMVHSGSDAYELRQPRLSDNTLCLGCHAGDGPFGLVGMDDVAALASVSDSVKLNGTAVTFDAMQVMQARGVIAQAITEHMEATSSMGMAMYDPTNDQNPVGRCASCHMPKTGKKNATADITQWRLGRDANGASAMLEGNSASHVFDVVWPWQSAILKRDAGVDLDIMPNSCGKCHAGARLSGD